MNSPTSILKKTGLRFLICCMLFAMFDTSSMFAGIGVKNAYANETSSVINGFESASAWTATGSSAGTISVTQATYPKTEGDYASKVSYRMNAGVRNWVNYSWNTGGLLDLSGAGKLLVDVYPESQTNGPREPLTLKIGDAAGIVYERQLQKLTAGRWNTIELDLAQLPTPKNKITYINFYSFGGFDFEGRAEVSYTFDNLRVQYARNMAEPVQAVPGEGTVTVGTSVYLSTPTVGAAVYYTLDGTDPRTSSSKKEYAQPIPIEKETTIEAYAAKSGLSDSIVSTFHYVAKTGAEGEYLLDLNRFIGTMGGGKLAPLLSADNILIDGVFDEWEGYGGIELPADAQRQVQMSGWTGNADLSSRMKFAYDADHFYLAANVIDNAHQSYAGDGMWKGDSLQMAFSPDGIKYGPEFGFALVNGQPQVWQWSAGTGTLGKESIELRTARYGNETIYEAKVPWQAIFADGLQGAVPFTILINDNDGGGRKGYIEWTGGVGRFKDPTQFGILKPVGVGDEWDAWIIPGFEPNVYAVAIPNYSEQPLHINVSIPLLHIQTDVTIPPKAVFRKDLNVQALPPGKHTLQAIATESATGKVVTTTELINVLAGKDDIVARFDAIAVKLPALEQLLADAEVRGLAADYEKVNYTVVKNFISYGRQDIAKDYLERAQYVAEELESLYTEAESRLHAYLGGSLSPYAVPRYVTGQPLTIKDYSFIADTIAPGDKKAKKRPVFFTGYGHFGQVRTDIPQFEEYGTNIIQMEIGPSSVIKEPGSLTGWSIFKAGGVKAEAVADRTVFRSGNVSIKLSNASPTAPQVYLSVTQNIPVKPNSTYHFKAWVKGENVKSVWFPGGPDWTQRKRFPDGTYDWTEVKFEYTTGEGETKFPFLIVSEDVSGNVWIDDASMTEAGTAVNLLSNPGFEESYANNPGKDYAISTELIEKDILKELQNAAEHNIAVNLLISPHYFPEWAMKKWPETRFDSNSQFIHFNIDAPKSREIIEDYLRTLIPLVKDSPSLHSITISNEPVYESNKNDYHLPAWHQYLESLYTDIGRLNEVYGTDYGSFADVSMPLSNQPSPRFYDWVTFNNSFFADWHRGMVDIIHELAPDIPLHSKTMNGAFLRGALVWGVDPEQFAGFSQINGDDNVSYLDMGMDGLLNYLKFYDLQTSLKKAPVFNSEEHLIADRDNRYIPEQVSHVRSVLWQGAVHGRGASTIWVWERSYNPKSDFYGSILHRPDVTAEVGRTNLDLNRLAMEVTALQRAKSKVAILYSLPSMVYELDYPNSVAKAYEAASLSGQKVGFITEKQALDGLLSEYKVILIPEASHVKAETLAALKAFVAGGGRLFIIGDQSVQYNEQNKPLDASIREDVINHRNTTVVPGSLSAGQLRTELLPLLDRLGLNDVVLIDAETGQPVQNVEWRSVKLEGKLLINVDNYSAAPKRVYVQYKGKRAVKWQDLLNGESSAANVIELKSMQPRLLSLDPKDDFQQ